MQLLFRNSPDYKDEIEIARKYFLVSTNRSYIINDVPTIARYCAQPFYSELVDTLSIFNSKPINDLSHVEYINSMAWATDLGERTPRTWFEGEFAAIPEVPTIAKGRVRSIRERWKTDMYCGPEKKDRAQLYSRLLDNDYLREQGIVFREYVPLKNDGVAFTGMPIANEWRLFFYRKQLIDYGYYWVSYEEKSNDQLPMEALLFAQQCAMIVGDKANFYTMDIAEKENGGWTLIELNEGQQSGLCGINADSFYKNLRNIL